MRETNKKERTKKKIKKIERKEKGKKKTSQKQDYRAGYPLKCDVQNQTEI